MARINTMASEEHVWRRKWWATQNTLGWWDQVECFINYGNFNICMEELIKQSSIVFFYALLTLHCSKVMSPTVFKICFIPLCACVRECGAYAHLCVSTHLEGRRCWVSYLSLSVLIPERGWGGCQKALMFFLCMLSEHWHYRHQYSNVWLFMWVLECKLRSPWLHRKNSYHWATSSAYNMI